MDRAERFSDLYQRQYEAVLRYALRRTDPETAGAVSKTFAAYTRTYSGLPQEGKVTTPCQVIAIDTTGQHTLASCPAFGRIDDGAFTALAHSSDDYGAAW
jgi:hypothetical protein